MHMIAVATAQLSSFLVCFKLFLKKNEMESMATHQAPSRGAGGEQGKREREGAYLTDATSPIHFCRKMLGVEGGVLDHPKALNDLVLTKPCTYISNPVLKIEQFLPSERVSDDEGVNLSVLFYYMVCSGRVPHMSCCQHRGANPDTDHKYPFFPIISLFGTSSVVANKKFKQLKKKTQHLKKILSTNIHRQGSPLKKYCKIYIAHG